MRCPECNKFASYDDSTDPEVTIHHDERDNSIEVEVRIVLTHEDCGTELKEANFTFEETIPDNEIEGHIGADHTIEIEESDVELYSHKQSGKMYYGVRVEVTARCSCQRKHEYPLWVHEFKDEIRSSEMDEI